MKLQFPLLHAVILYAGQCYSCPEPLLLYNFNDIYHKESVTEQRMCGRGCNRDDKTTKQDHCVTDGVLALELF